MLKAYVRQIKKVFYTLFVLLWLPLFLS